MSSLTSFSVIFHTKITTISENIDDELLDARDNIPSGLHRETSIPGGKLDTFRILPSDDVQKVIMKSPTNCCVLDPLLTRLVKRLSEPLLPTITRITNKSLESGVFANLMITFLIIIYQR